MMAQTSRPEGSLLTALKLRIESLAHALGSTAENEHERLESIGALLADESSPLQPPSQRSAQTPGRFGSFQIGQVRTGSKSGSAAASSPPVP